MPTYSNSVVRIAAQAGVAVMVMRDGLDGDVRFQYPAEKVVREYESHAAGPEEARPVDAAAKGDEEHPKDAPQTAGTEAPKAPAAAAQAPVVHTKLIA